MDENITVILTIDVEVYLRHRNDSLMVKTTLPVPLVAITEGSVAEIMTYAIHMVEDEISSSQRMMFVDDRNNVRIFNTKDIQSISLLAPDSLPDVTGLDDNEHE